MMILSINSNVDSKKSRLLLYTHVFSRDDNIFFIVFIMDRSDEMKRAKKKKKKKKEASICRISKIYLNARFRVLLFGQPVSCVHINKPREPILLALASFFISYSLFHPSYFFCALSLSLFLPEAS
jgi:hypothetical protein